jgi:hypothetical protein
MIPKDQEKSGTQFGPQYNNTEVKYGELIIAATRHLIADVVKYKNLETK